MPTLYSVYKGNDGECGVESFGPQRRVLLVKEGSVRSDLTVTLEDMTQTLGSLLRRGFKLHLQSAFFNSAKNEFQEKHPDFDNCKGGYAVFCEPVDIAQAVSNLQAMGNPIANPTLRTEFMAWLREQDQHEEYVVASKANPLFALLVAEYASLNGLVLHTATDGSPALPPSAQVELWTRWLSVQPEQLVDIKRVFSGGNSANFFDDLPMNDSKPYILF